MSRDERMAEGLRMDAPRIGPADVLALMREDLERQARALRGYDADAREGWLAACAQVLAQVPQELQRVAWAWSLTQAMPMAGCMGRAVTAELLARAASWKAEGR